MVAGHLREKSGYYYAVLNYTDSLGKRKTKWISTGLTVKGNKKRAEAILMDARRNFNPEEPKAMNGAADTSGKLAIVSEQNAGNPLRYGMKPLMCFDVWEHAYYIDYRNRRADAVAALWDRIDWKVVEERYAKK